jgi:Tol biopolymer transport system component
MRVKQRTPRAKPLLVELGRELLPFLARFADARLQVRVEVPGERPLDSRVSNGQRFQQREAALLRRPNRDLGGFGIVLCLLVLVVGVAGEDHSQQSGRVLFSSQRDGDYDIFVMNADGSGQTNLTNNSGQDFDPAWSPDGTKIAFSGLPPPPGDQHGEIYVMNADGSGLTNLTNHELGDYEPAWSADGTRIAFRTNRTFNDEIFVMNRDGSAQTNVTNNPAADLEPTWSPDGTKIAFTTYRGGNYDVFVMNADGSGQTNLTKSPVADGSPDWSPDGARIAFKRWTTGPPDVFVMNADGNGQTNVTNDPYADQDPAWLPNGSMIVFSSGRAGPFLQDEIFVVKADGSGPRNLTNSSGFDIDPDWIGEGPPPLPPPPQPPPPPPPLPPPAPPACHVPRVIGLQLVAARPRIRRANCSVGRIRRARSRRVGRVIAQSPRAGAHRPRGARVRLVVGRRRA